MKLLGVGTKCEDWLCIPILFLLIVSLVGLATKIVSTPSSQTTDRTAEDIPVQRIGRLFYQRTSLLDAKEEEEVKVVKRKSLPESSRVEKLIAKKSILQNEKQKYTSRDLKKRNGKNSKLVIGKGRSLENNVTLPNVLFRQWKGQLNVNKRHQNRRNYLQYNE